MRSDIRRLRQNLGAWIACRLGLHLLWRAINRRRLLILVYHGVAAEPLEADTPDWHHVPLREFRRQIRWLTRHYDVLDVDTALEKLRRGRLIRPTACITFDDGYANNRSAALPVLREHGAPAAIYLVTGMVGTERVLWTVELEAGFRRSRLQSIELVELGLGNFVMRGVTERVAAARTICRQLKTCSGPEREAALSHIWARLDTRPAADPGHFRMMTWDDAVDMETTGLVTFGAHTVNHEIVSCLDDASLAREIDESCRAVRRHLSRPSRTFAYPNGRSTDFDSRARTALKSAGIDWGLTTIDGLNDAATDAYSIRRITVENDTSFARFRLAASGFLTSVRSAVAPNDPLTREHITDA